MIVIIRVEGLGSILELGVGEISHGYGNHTKTERRKGRKEGSKEEKKKEKWDLSLQKKIWQEVVTDEGIRNWDRGGGAWDHRLI